MGATKQWRWTVLAGVLALLGAGCEGEPTETPASTPDGDPQLCAAHSACGEGAACLAGSCTQLGAELSAAQHCADNTDCPADELCRGGVCVAAQDGDALSCAANADCPAWSACLGGLCVVIADADGDGFSVPEDCDDLDAERSPASPERCDGLDNDCDGEVDEDCSTPPVCIDDADCPAGMVCDAATLLCRPHGTMPPVDGCNGLDDDGDGLVDEDCNGLPCAADAGCAADQWCDAATGLCVGAGDADGDGIADAEDVCPNVYDPAQTDTDADGVGDACDEDLDNDGAPAGLDCNDLDPSISPYAPEVCGDALDNDCDGTIDEGCGAFACVSDADCLAGQQCDAATGLCVPAGGGDGDADGDGISDAWDNCPSVPNPEQADTDADAVGDACDADADSDGSPAGEDCDDYDASRSPFAPELCDGLDNDCDGMIDEGC